MLQSLQGFTTCCCCCCCCSFLLLLQVLETAEHYGVPLAGENALQRYDEHAFDRIAESAFGRTARAGGLGWLFTKFSGGGGGKTGSCAAVEGGDRLSSCATMRSTETGDTIMVIFLQGAFSLRP